MSLSPVLAVTLMTQSQSGKDITVNDQLRAVERGRGYLSLPVPGSGSTTLLPDWARHGVIEVTGALTGARTLDIPGAMDSSLIVINSTTGAFPLSVGFGGNPALVIPRGCAVPVRRSGTATVFDARGGMVRLPEVVAYRSGTTQTLGNNAETVVQFNSESRDTAEAFDPSTAWRFTAPAPGLYVVNAMVEVTASGSVAGTYNGHAAVRRNAAVQRRGEQAIAGVLGAGQTARHGVQAMLPLAAGDNVDVVVANGHTAGTLVAAVGADRTYIEVFCLRLGT